MAKKQKGFVQLWLSFMDKFIGNHSYGRFGKLLEVCGQVGWMIDDPYVVDNDGYTFNILEIDVKLMER